MSGPSGARRSSAGGRVVIVEAYPHLRGGAQRVNLALAAGLPTHGWSCEVIVPGDGAAVDALRAAGIAVVPLPAGPSMQQYGRPRASPRIVADLARWWVGLVRHLRARDRNRPTVLVVSDQRGLVLGAVAARLARVPLVWHIHSAEPSTLLRRMGVSLAAAVVVPSPRTAARMPGRDTHVVPNGVEAIPAAPPAPPDAVPSLLTVGRLHPDKDLGTLLEAVARLRPTRPGLTLSIVGSEQAGHEHVARDLRERAAELEIDQAVSFAGDTEQPFARAHERTVYVQASARETFGLALAEAMAIGLPVVATATDGAVELIDEGRTGLLVPKGNPVALAAAVDRLLGNETLARSLGSEARREVTRRYSPAAMLSAEAAVLDAVARRR